MPKTGHTEEQIVGVLEELAALAGALRKPLTARLLPIPGLKAGDMLTFDLPGDTPMAGGLCNSRVMRIEN